MLSSQLNLERKAASSQSPNWTPLMNYNSIPSLTCPECGKKFRNDQLAADLHKFDHVDEIKPLTYLKTLDRIFCIACDREFPGSTVFLLDHLENAKHKLNIQCVCEICCELFSSRKNFIRHLHYCHGFHPNGGVCMNGSEPEKTEVVEFRCGDCGEKFETAYLMAVHWMKNEGLHGGYMCEVCGECCFNVLLLRRHQKTGHKIRSNCCNKWMNEYQAPKHSCKLKR